MIESEPQSDGPIIVAVNPRAAFGASTSAGPRTEARLRSKGIEPVMLQETDYQSLESAVVRHVASGIGALIVVGGDGMVNLGANALAGTAIPLGIVPVGTGNDVARGLNVPRAGIETAVDHLLTALAAPPRYIDLGRVRCAGTSRYFAAVLSAGFDAVVNERANRWRWPRGRGRYVGAMLRELTTFQPMPYEMTVDDGGSRPLDAMLISVANGTSMGGGMQITPQARYDDGQLDLLVVSRLSRMRFLALFPKVFFGRHTRHRCVSIEQVSSVRLDSPGLIAYADGERIGPLPCDIAAVPTALRVLA